MSTVALITFGCKVNQYESQVIAEEFVRRGYQLSHSPEKADIFVINTCTVTQTSDQQARQMIRRLARENPQARIIVTGCYAQANPSAIAAIPGVDLIVGNFEKLALVDYLSSYAPGSGPHLIVSKFADQILSCPPISNFYSHSRAFVKVQDGCEQNCSYCIVPQVRGPQRSRPAKEILQEVEGLVAAGFPEIVLAGIRLGTYGREWKGGLPELLQLLLLVKGLGRIRLSSLEPVDVTPELINIVASSPKICPHWHLPLQSGDEEILKAMRRPYSPSQYRELINTIRFPMPDAAITTDIMVGFPGETEERFQNTLRFISEIEFSGMHVFRFSPRPQTKAIRLPGKVSSPVVKERSKRLLDLSRQLARRYRRRFLGQMREVVVETRRDRQTALLTGYTDNYLRVFLPGEDSWCRRLIPVLLEEEMERGLTGEAVITAQVANRSN